MNTLFNVKLERLRSLGRVVPILGVGERVHLVTHVFCVSETTQVPPRVVHHRELPTPVTEGVRANPLEELCSCDHCPIPRLARKQIVE